MILKLISQLIKVAQANQIAQEDLLDNNNKNNKNNRDLL